MFANMGGIGHRDNEFAFGLGDLLSAGVPTFQLGFDVLGDIFHGAPVVWGRSPLEAEVLGTRHRVSPLLADDIWRRNIGDIFDV